MYERGTPPWAGKSALVATSESTSSGSFTDLTTAGPSVTLDVPASGKVRITLSARIVPSGTTSGWMGVDISGASTVAPSQARAVSSGIGSNGRVQASFSYVHSGLTPGSTTFKAQYRADDGALNSAYSNREIIVDPLP